MISNSTHRLAKRHYLLSLLFLVTSLLTTSTGYAQNLVSGRVTTAAGAPIPSASVMIKGTNLGTSTYNNGNFSLNVADANATLLITSLGYGLQEINLGGRTEVTVTLAE